MKSILKLLFLLVVLAMSISAQGQNLSTCLLLDLPFNGSIQDQGPNNYSATPSSTIDYVSDRFGNPNSALNFDGTSDYITLNNNNAVITGTAFTISTWLKVNGTGGGTHLQNFMFQQRGNSTSNPNIINMMHSTDPIPSTRYGANSTAVGSIQTINTTPPSIGVWHHYAMVVGDDSLVGYIDGVKFGAIYLPDGGTYTNVDYVAIGSHNYLDDIRGLLNGDIDDFKIFDCTLNQEQVLEFYEMPDATSIGADIAEFTSPTIYPNPTKDIFYVTWNSINSKLVTLKLLNLSGQIVCNQSTTTSETATINVSSLPAGVYILNIVSENMHAELKLVKN